MLIKNIITSNELDMHNQQFTVEELEKIARDLTESECAVRMGLQHDPTVMPVGKIISGRIVEYEKDHIGVEADIDIFIDEFIETSFDGDEVLFVGESKFDSRPFMSQVASDGQKNCLMINPLIVAQSDYNEIVKCIEENEDFELKELVQKSAFNDLQIWLYLAIGSLGILTAEKTYGKLSDHISDDVVTVYNKTKKMLLNLASKVFCRKQVVYVISEPEQPIELVIITNDANELMRSFGELQNGEIALLYKKYNDYLLGGIAKIQFVYNNVEAKWELSYIMTYTGQVIGTYKTYRKAVKLFQETMNSPTPGFSIGATREPTREIDDD